MMWELLEMYGFIDESLVTTDWIRENLQFGNRPVYEVIRLIDDCPLFFDDHIERLAQSCRIVGMQFHQDPAVIRKRIGKLSDTCNCHNGNLKIVYGEPETGSRPVLLIAFIPHFFPGPDRYETGVPVTLLPMERTTPNAKLAKEKPRTLHDLIDFEHGYYEVLMVNSDNVVTEGSRSNVFFIKKTTVFTSPLEDVLPGITRKKVLQIIDTLHIEVQFERIKQDRLAEFDSIFLTGTSPGVLPVRSVNELVFTVNHPLLLNIMKHYRQMIRDSLTR
jgi:branched-chain amino acid aminotransferase